MGGEGTLLAGEVGSVDIISQKFGRPAPRRCKPLSPNHEPGIHKGIFSLHRNPNHCRCGTNWLGRRRMEKAGRKYVQHLTL